MLLLALPALAVSPQATAQVGMVVDFGRELRAGFEIALDGRIVFGSGWPGPSVGAVARAGWRAGAGPFVAAAARGGVVHASGCPGSTHVVAWGGEAEAGVELSTELPPALLAGANLPFGSLWFGFQAAPRVLARFDREGFDAVQIGGDLGAVLAYPDCGWELE